MANPNSGIPCEDADADADDGANRRGSVGDSSSVNLENDTTKKQNSVIIDQTNLDAKIEQFMSGNWSGIIDSIDDSNDSTEECFRSPYPAPSGIFTPFRPFRGSEVPLPSGYHVVQYDDPVQRVYVDEEGECEHCGICYKAHLSRRCPYFNRLPRGAAFDSTRYEIWCVCGNTFNVDKWYCTLCSRTWPVLMEKYCSICHIWTKHNSYDCPMDKVEAAIYKSIRDEMLSKVLIPYMPSAESSSGSLCG